MYNARLLLSGVLFLLFILVLPPFLLTAMHRYTSLALPAFPFLWTLGKAQVPQNHANGTDPDWYPPKQTWINSLSNVINGTGTHGFVFSGSELPPGTEYSTYNWCNMPHVRKEEYVVPGKEYELKYVEVIHRHHKRTPYAHNAFPREAYGWDCSNQALYTYGSPLGPSTNHSAQTHWSLFTSSTNPFTAPGFPGSCQFPQITKGGLDDSWQHGKDLFGVYHDLLHFLPSTLDNEKVRFRVTNNVITSQVSGMLISGMYPQQAIPGTNTPLHIQPKAVDSLKPDYACPPASTLYSSYGVDSQSQNWTKHLSAAKHIFATLDAVSGIPGSDHDWHMSFDHYFDNLSARQCHDKVLPCAVNKTSPCATQDLADTVYRLGQYEYSFLYRDSPDSLRAAVGSYGVWIAELAQNIRDAMAGDSGVLYRHNVAHDGSLARLLSILQVEVMVWPGMGAEVVFELYKKEKKWFVRILWGGRVLRSSHPALGEVDMVDVEVLLGYFEGLVGRRAEKVVEFCGSGK